MHLDEAVLVLVNSSEYWQLESLGMDLTGFPTRERLGLNQFHPEDATVIKGGMNSKTIQKKKTFYN